MASSSNFTLGTSAIGSDAPFIVCLDVDALDGATLRLSYLQSMLTTVGVAMMNAEGSFGVSDAVLGEAICGMAMLADDIRGRLVDGKPVAIA